MTGILNVLGRRVATLRNKVHARANVNQCSKTGPAAAGREESLLNWWYPNQNSSNSAPDKVQITGSNATDTDPNSNLKRRRTSTRMPPSGSYGRPRQPPHPPLEQDDIGQGVEAEVEDVETFEVGDVVEVVGSIVKSEEVLFQEEDESMMDDGDEDESDIEIVPEGLKDGGDGSEEEEDTNHDPTYIPGGQRKSPRKRKKSSSVNQTPDPIGGVLPISAEECLKKLKELEDVRKLLEKSLPQEAQRPAVPRRVPSIGTYPSLPLQTLEEFEETEKCLTSRDQFNSLVEELRRVGGTTVTKTIYNTLRRLLSRNLAQGIRFTDNSGKISFGNLKLATAVREAVRCVWDEKSASDATINLFMGKYFRNTPDRPERGGGNKATK